MCFLEFSYLKSSYNFDIQLHLVKIFHKYGLSISFGEAYDTLDIKGVLLESLGYLSINFLLRWAYMPHFTVIQQKMNKYLRNNISDISESKLHALNDFNFVQF